MDGLRLADLRKPLGAVTFLSGTVIVPVPFGPAEYALWRELQRETDPQKAGEMGFAIIRACYPGVTDDDLLDCDSQMLLELAAYPGGKIEQVRAALKNVEAVAVAEQGSQPPPSSPTTNGSTSASKSRRRSGKTSGTSTTASHTDAPSSSGTATIGSTSRSGSTNSGASSTTSTAPPSSPTP